LDNVNFEEDLLMSEEFLTLVTTYGPLVAMVFIFYFMIYRPQKDEHRKRAQMLATLHKGNKIMTVGGLYGEVVDIDDDIVELKIADKVIIKIAKASINSNISQGVSMSKEDKDTKEEKNN